MRRQSRGLFFLFISSLVGKSAVSASNPAEEVPNDVRFPIVRNNYRHSIRVRRCDRGWRGVFYLDFEHQANEVILDNQSRSAPEFIDLLSRSNDEDVAVPFGSFITNGPSQIEAQSSRGDFQDYQRSFGRIGMQHGSQFARRFRNMLIRTVETGGLEMAMDSMGINYVVRPIRFGSTAGFEMIANIADPTVYAFENQMAFVSAVDGIELGIRTRVSILSNEAESIGVQSQAVPPTRSSSDIVTFQIDIGDLTIPSVMRQALVSEIERISGLSIGDFERSSVCQDLLDRLPVLQFSLYNAEDDSHVVDVHITPNDYIVRGNERRPCTIAVQNAGHFGINAFGGFSFWKNVGIFVDYENRRFGIFDQI